MTCLSEEELVPFLFGRPSAELTERVEGHIDTCSTCHELLVLLGRASLAPPDGTLPGGLPSLSQPLQPPPLVRGALVDRYIVLDKVGAGGMGVVYAAYDPELNRKVALKLLRNELSEDGQERFLREARALARLAHPNVISIHDIGVQQDQVFIVMELVDGVTLREWLAAAPRPWRAVLDVLRQAGVGLHAAHFAGLVHRDFKPDNVLVGRDGRVRVLDFGLACAVPLTDAC